MVGESAVWRLLVVDDDPTIRRGLRRVLGLSGFAVEAVDEVEPLARDHAVNCASSVEPFSASVDASGDTACVTRSK